MTHTADPRVDAKRANRPYFILQGNVCTLLAAKDHVDLFES
jgi:hypothetical protein